MKVTAQEEYGLRCMVQLAKRQKEGRLQPLTLGEVARDEGLTVAYVAKLIRSLRRSGLVRSVLGRTGGYVLARDADKITLLEILSALGGKMYDTEYCNRFPGEQAICTHMGDCSIRSVWGTIRGLIDGVLIQTRLADLVNTERQMTATLSERRLQAVPSGPGCR